MKKLLVVLGVLGILGSSLMLVKSSQAQEIRGNLRIEIGDGRRDVGDRMRDLERAVRNLQERVEFLERAPIPTVSRESRGAQCFLIDSFYHKPYKGEGRSELEASMNAKQSCNSGAGEAWCRSEPKCEEIR